MCNIPSVETVAGQFLVLPENPFNAEDVVLDVIVPQSYTISNYFSKDNHRIIIITNTFTSDTTCSLEFVSSTPKEVRNLEKSVVQRSIRIERSYCGSVEFRFPTN